MSSGINLLTLLDNFARGSEVFDKYLLIASFILFLSLSSYSKRQKPKICLTLIISSIVARELISIASINFIMLQIEINRKISIRH